MCELSITNKVKGGWWHSAFSFKIFCTIAGLGYITYLFTAFNDTAAKMPTGFWIHHSGNMLLSLQVNEEFLAAFCLFPEFKNSSSVSLRLKS